MNKSNIALYPMESVEAVVIELTMHAGSWYENGNKWGAHHLLEHLTFDGTKKFPKEIDIEIYKEQYGISSNAWTSGHYLTYHFKFPKANLNEALILLEETLFYSLIKEEDIKREVDVITQEYTDKWSSPHARFWQATSRNSMGKNHVYARDALGQPEYIKTLSRDELLKIQKHFYVSNNMYISVAGNFKKATVERRLDKIFSRHPKGKKQEIEKFEPTKIQKNYLWHKEDRDQVLISLVWGTDGMNKLSMEERIKLNLCYYIIGGSARSRLFKALRLNNGLVYNTGATHSYFPTYGEIDLYAATDIKKAKEVKKIMLDELSEFILKPIPKDEFERAVNYLSSRTLLSYDSVGGIASRNLDQLFYEGRVITAEEIIKILNSLTPDDVQKGISKYVENILPITSVMSKADPEIAD